MAGSISPTPQAAQCPVAKDARGASPGPAADKATSDAFVGHINAPSSTEAPEMQTIDKQLAEQGKAIPCPFWKVAISEGLVHPDAQGNISIEEMRSALSAVGAKPGIRETAILGVKAVLGPMTGVSGALATLNLDHINLFTLGDSPLMHTGDSGILRGGFNEARLDRLLSYSSDGQRVTLADLAAANKDQVAKDPGDHGHTLGSAEYTLLVTAFGKTDDKGEKYLSNKDLTTIYKDNKFPEDWKENHWGAIRTVSNTMEFLSDQKKDVNDPQAKTGVAAAGGGDAQKAKAAGVCPFLAGKPFTAEEVAQNHPDKLPPQ